MFDFSSISYNTENPTFITILLTVLSSFFLAGLIVFTYEKTSRQVVRPIQYLQALVLISIVAATVMQAIGDSLARGLGMLGALAIIRFRTTLRNPRNIVFMFSSLAAGISCGVYGFTVAFVGTIGFCAVAFLLRYSPFSQKQNLIGELKFDLPKEEDNFSELEALFKRYCKDYVLKSYQVYTAKKKRNLVSYHYRLRLEEEMQGWNLSNELRQIPGIGAIRLEFIDSSVEI